jgi:hypothetical protein
MPVDMSRYPENWREISRAVRVRAGNRCEWCGVVNGARGARDRYGRWHDEDDIDQLNSSLGEELFGGDYPRITRIILTVHHIGIDKPDGTPGDKHDKLDCRDENLVALCQKCHLAADMDSHVRNAALTRLRRRVEAGQVPLPLTGEGIALPFAPPVAVIDVPPADPWELAFEDLRRWKSRAWDEADERDDL